MKQIIIFLFLSAFVVKANAQTDYLPTGYWQYVNGNDTIDIFLTPGRVTLPLTNKPPFPVLNGYHRYVKNGVVVENTLQYLNTSSPNTNRNKYSLLIQSGYTPQDKKYDGQLKDMVLQADRGIVFEKLTPTQIKVDLYYLHGIRKDHTHGFTLPRHFILTKI